MGTSSRNIERNSFTLPYEMTDFSEYRRHFAKVCFIHPDNERGIHKMIDWGSGPDNKFIDAAMRYFTDGQLEYDKDTEGARQGNIDQEVLDNFLDNNPCIDRLPPKTTNRGVSEDGEAQALIDECLERRAEVCHRHSRHPHHHLELRMTISHLRSEDSLREFHGRPHVCKTIPQPSRHGLPTT